MKVRLHPTRAKSLVDQYQVEDGYSVDLAAELTLTVRDGRPEATLEVDRLETDEEFEARLTQERKDAVEFSKLIMADKTRSLEKKAEALAAMDLA